MERVAITGIRQPIIFDKQHDCPFEKPFGYIYRVTNKINGHMYIGKHAYNKPELDKSYHGSGTRLKYAYNKYGIENFTMEILEWIGTNDDDLNEAEIKWIDTFDTYHNPEHYNMTPGGDGVSSEMMLGENNTFFGKRHTEETKKKLSEQKSGENNPNYGKTGEDSFFYGKHHTEETRKKISSANKGKHVSEETKKKLSEMKMGENNSFYGKHHTEETKKKISRAGTGRMVSEETRKKLSESQKGKVIPEETRRKISKSLSGENHPNYGKTGENSFNIRKVVQLDTELILIKEYSFIRQVMEYGFNECCVGDCCNGRQKTHKGYKRMYKEDYEAMLQQREAQ